MLAIEKHENGLRVRVYGKRIHHGLTGIVAITIGAILTIHDRKDWRIWFRFNL